MKPKGIIIITFLFFMVSLLGCGPKDISMTSDRGSAIDHSQLSNIKKGETKTSQIYKLFGAPDEVKNIGNEALLIYKHCIDTVTFQRENFFKIIESSHLENCDELIFIVDSTKSIIKDYHYKEMQKK